jgi:endonuclease III
VERWFLASTLFGARISVQIAARTFRGLESAGIHRITDARCCAWEALVGLLDAGGYTRYDYRTATRLQELARVVAERYKGAVGVIGKRFPGPDTLTAALDDLPGWGPVTVRLFLREMRGVWPGAQLPVDPEATTAGVHLGLLSGEDTADRHRLMAYAQQVGCDERDLEAALVRVSLAHRQITQCPGRADCVVLATRSAQRVARQ